MKISKWLFFSRSFLLVLEAKGSVSLLVDFFLQHTVLIILVSFNV